MRLAALALLLLAAPPAGAEAVSVNVRPARAFGFFVGDLIAARVDVSAPAEATLSAASLPRPGALSTALELRKAALSEERDGARKIWRLDLVYQNFYVALDARTIDIPGFELKVDTAAGAETVKVPAWRAGVAPLREIAPDRETRAGDYLRPDGPAAFVDEAVPRGVSLALAATLAFSILALARDRAWPPFHRRPARVFSALSRRLAAISRSGAGEECFARALREAHRAIDAKNGACVLASDLPDFFDKRPEFAPLRAEFERFFAASARLFFGDGAGTGFGWPDLLRFVAALAARERRV
ncbi:nonribosomal peptide synthetase MxaA [Methylocystis sp. S23]